MGQLAQAKPGRAPASGRGAWIERPSAGSRERRGAGVWYTSAMRFLCVSDIHGHVDRLRAVLAEGRLRGFHKLVVCGDSLFPGPEPLATWKLLLEHRALCVQGVSDRALCEVDATKLVGSTAVERERIERLAAVQREVGDLILARLGKLPTRARLPLESGLEAVVVHGSPVDPTEPLYLDMDDHELSALLGDDPGDLVVCGASHVPFQRRIGDVQVLSVGSVGESPIEGYAHGAIVDASEVGMAIEPFDVRL